MFVRRVVVSALKVNQRLAPFLMLPTDIAWLVVRAAMPESREVKAFIECQNLGFEMGWAASKEMVKKIEAGAPLLDTMLETMLEGSVEAYFKGASLYEKVVNGVDQPTVN